MATAVAMAGGGQDFMVAQDARSRLWAWNVSALKLAYEHWNDSWLLEDTEAWWKRRAIIISLENHWKKYHKANNQFKTERCFNPLHLNNNMHILHTVLYTFPMVLKRRICLTITSFNLELVIPSFILVRDSEVILIPNTQVLKIRFRVTKRPSKVIQFYFWLINIYTNLEGCNAFVVFGTSFRYLFS